MATFARVMTWDPDARGQMPDRAEEFQAELVFPGRELSCEDGLYLAPVWRDDRCVIGLEWEENRCLHTLGLTIGKDVGAADADTVVVEYWRAVSKGKEGRPFYQGGREWPGSRWQGEWVPLDVTPERKGSHLTWRPGDAHPCVREGTMKVRWVFPNRKTAAAVTGFVVRSPAEWKVASLRIEADPRLVIGPATLSVYNGELCECADPVGPLAWDIAKSLNVDVVYSRPPAGRPDLRYGNRTLLTLNLPQTAVSIAVEDVLDCGPVFVPSVGVYISSAVEGRDLAAYRSEIADKSTVRERVHDMPDQRLDRAMAYRNPCGDSSPTLLSLACHNRKAILLRGGTLISTRFSVEPSFVDSEFFCMSPAFGVERYREGSAATWTEGWGKANSGRIRRWLREGWLPIVQNEFAEGSVEYRQCTFVAPLDDVEPQSRAWCGDRRSVCVAEFTIENSGAVDAEARLELVFESRSQTHPPALDDSRTPGTGSGTDNVFVLEGEKVHAVVNTASGGPLDVECSGGVVVLSGTLPAGARAACLVYVSEKTIEVAEAAGDSQYAQQLRTRTAHYWEEALASGADIDVPDGLFRNILRASLVRILIDARNEADGERVAPWIAAFAYGALENESQTLIQCMTRYGFTEVARRSLDYFLHCYSDEGLLSTGYTMMGTPWNLWALAQYYDFTGDREWLADVTPAMRKACRWIVQQRRKTMTTNAAGEKVPEYGLIPPGLTGDWTRFGYRFYSQAIYFAGLSNGARVLQELGEEDDGELVEEAQRFRDDIVRAYRIAQSRHPVLPLPNGAWVRSYPCMIYGRGRAGLLFPSGNRTNTYTYDVDHGAMHLIALGVLDASADEAEEMLDEIEDVAFLQDCHGNPLYTAERSKRLWFDCGGFSKYYVGHNRICEIYAGRDEVKPFIRSLLNCIPAALDAENLTFWEHGIGAAWDKTHHTANILLGVRSMFVCERADELWLAPYVPSHYLEDGKAVGVERAPSAFGEICYRIVSRLEEGVIEVDVDPPSRRAPEVLVLRVRHPDGQAISSVTVNGEPHADFDEANGTIRLPAGEGRLHVVLKY